MVRRSCPGFVLLGASAIAATLAGCSTVEGTGRKQLMLIPTSQELTLGEQAYQEVLSTAKVSKDRRSSEILTRVGRRIAEAADRPNFEWEFTLIDSPEVNAFCLPGGKIAVYTGILPVMENEAGMAVVLGHEVAHAVARHGAERMSQGVGVELAQQALSVGLKDASPASRAGVLRAFGIGADVGVLLPYSRTHELEADQMGLLYAAKAGYDPQEAVRFWQRMDSAGGGRPPEFFSTHPHSERRIEQLNEHMPAAAAAYQGAAERYGRGEKL